MNNTQKEKNTVSDTVQDNIGDTTNAEVIPAEVLEPGDLILIPVRVTDVELDADAILSFARIGFQTMDATDIDGNLIAGFQTSFLRGTGGNDAMYLFRQDPDEFRGKSGKPDGWILDARYQYPTDAGTH